MFVNETQRRRPVEKSDTDTKAQDSSSTSEASKKNKNRMPTWIRCSPSNVKKIMVSLVVLYIVYKIYQLMTYSQPGVIPPDPQKATVSWIYKENPQGIDQDGLADLLDHISRGRNVDHVDKDSHKGAGSLRKTVGELPRVKKPYQSTGSLTFKKRQFYLGGKPFRIFSGAMHYFRVPEQHWEDRMKKMIAGGLNTLETYVSWNLHEDTPGNFTFDGMLNIRKYIQLAQELGLKVILRPGPYICSEWDFGGLPAWLLKDPNMRVRSNYHGYQEAVERFFGKLIPFIADLQYSKGGPIIAVQIENEFGSYSSEVEHLLYLKRLLIKLGIEEMFFTSDGFVSPTKSGFHVAPFYEEALPTGNFKKFSEGESVLKLIENISEDFPLVVMEFWAGWFDHWQSDHAVMGSSTRDLAINLKYILNTGASVNFYMYHGGTNFGFMAGANWFNNSRYKPDVTSYDYIAPLSEAGDLTPKYEVVRELLRKVSENPKIPDPPANTFKGDYGKVVIDHYMHLEDMLTPVKAKVLDKPVPMEMLSHNNGVGQNYGFILYRAHPDRGQKLTFENPVNDRVQIIVNGIQVGMKDWFTKKWEVTIPKDKMTDANILDILVENHGRVNYVKQGFNKFNEERKGISGNVLLDGSPITEWKVYPLEFKPPYIKRVMESKKWKVFANWEGITALYRGTLSINGTPRDTFINMKGWTKGNIFINGFNIGRYWKEGPQKTLYVPASVLKTGKNEYKNRIIKYKGRKTFHRLKCRTSIGKGNALKSIVIFELHKGYDSVIFQNTHVIG